MKRRGCFDEAERLLLSDIERPSVPKLQAMILVIKHREHARRFAGVFMLTALAARHVTALRLNYEHEALPPIARETFRRTAWSLFTIDTHLAGGYRDFSLFPSEIMHVALLCGEEAFALGGSEGAPILQDFASHTVPSPLACVIRVRWLRHKVLAFTKQMALGPVESCLDCKVQGLQAELDSFWRYLPEDLGLCPRASRLHAYSTTFPQFATINIVFHGAHLILYRLVLDGMKEALRPQALTVIGPEICSSYRQRCFDHAIALCKGLAGLTEARPTWALLDLDLAVSAYQCLRVTFCLQRMGQTGVSTDEIQSYAQTCREFVACLFPDCEAIRYIVSSSPVGL